MYEFQLEELEYHKMTPSYVRDTREFYKNHVRREFVRYLAYEGYFDKIFDKRTLQDAKLGKLPPNLDIHHINPISGGGDNSFSNLVVLDKATHKFINKTYFQPQLQPHLKDPYGSVYTITVPTFESYVDYENIISLEKVRRIQRFMKNKNKNFDI